MPTARADPDGEVAGSDGSGSWGKIPHVPPPPQIPDVEDWGIPPESQRPCDPEVEVCAIVSFDEISSLILFLFIGKADPIPYSQKRSKCAEALQRFVDDESVV